MAHLVVPGFDDKQKPEQVFGLTAALVRTRWSTGCSN